MVTITYREYSHLNHAGLKISRFDNKELALIHFAKLDNIFDIIHLSYSDEKHGELFKAEVKAKKEELRIQASISELRKIGYTITKNENNTPPIIISTPPKLQGSGHVHHHEGAGDSPDQPRSLRESVSVEKQSTTVRTFGGGKHRGSRGVFAVRRKSQRISQKNSQ